MKKSYFFLFLCSLLLGSLIGKAQYTFSDDSGGLGPYNQNFNTLTGNVTLTGNHLSALPEVYAEAEFPGYPAGQNYYCPTSIAANDGQNAQGSYYHFGYSQGANTTDRSLGGIATVSNSNGIGYLGIRFKNTTASTTITNLEVKYAMEQWYNSGRQDAAQVDVAYLTGSSVTSLLAATGNWVAVAALQVKAPSTATVIASRDGNSAANRRLVSTTITGLNLAPGQEIMLRWAYVLNNNTNGNGLSIDDVVVTPETGVFYSKTTGDLTALTNWGTNSDGSGVNPTSFGADNQVFYVMSANPGTNPTTSNASDRLMSNTTWTVNGANSKIIVGTAAAPAALMVEYNKNIMGKIDVSAGSYFLHRRTNAAGFTLGTLGSASTVDYNSNGTVHSVQPVQYGNLRISGDAATSRVGNMKMLTANTVVTGNLVFGTSGSGSTVGTNLDLGNYDLTVLGSNNISNYSATAYVVTSGSGRLRVLVPRATSSTTLGAVVTFPVGSSFTAYNPVTLQQTTTTSDDVFEVRVIEKLYAAYDATTYAPTGNQITSQAVNKTWFVSKEVPANASNVAMTTQWVASEGASDFYVANAHINHYTNGSWDTYLTQVGATGSGPYVAKRSGVTSFSPFGVSSRQDGTLPVVLTAFAAQRTSGGVQCDWTTASEVNSERFRVERSLDGQAFEAIGSVPAAGSSATERTYSFLDAKPLATLAYYRLRQIDFDGKEAFSPLVAVAGTTQRSAATATPNPGTGAFTISAGFDITGVEVLNSLGQVVYALRTPVPALSQPLELSSQPAGLYLVRLRTTGGTQVVRITKN